MVFIPSRETATKQQGPSAPLPLQTFRQFYRRLCQSVVAHPERACARWLSLTLPLPDTDPLVALDQLGGLEQQHFYWEQPNAGLAIAAADPCTSVQFHGPERFAHSQAFLENCLAATVILPPLGGHLSGGPLSKTVTPLNVLSGPRFFCSFTFFDQASNESRFPPATLFLPRWQVTRQHRPSPHSPAAGSSFVAHVTLQRGLPAQNDCRRLWQDYQQLLRQEKPKSHAPASRGVRLRTPNLDQRSDAEAQKFLTSVQSVLQAIDQGKLHKAVLARPLRVQFEQPISAIATLAALRDRHPDCHIFSVGAGPQRRDGRETHPVFVGASPERLLRVQNRRIKTEAIAGSAPRGQTPAEDQAFAQQLQTRPKEQHEHRLVSRFITDALGELGLTPEFATQPQLLKLRGIQHLRTPIACDLPPSIHPLEVLAKLHPTPAMAGVPQPVACAQIQALETFERSLYASPIGWIDGQGNCDFCVGIRSALIEGDRAQLFAGAGIVQGSEPKQELQEVALKLQTLLSVLSI